MGRTAKLGRMTGKILIQISIFFIRIDYIWYNTKAHALLHWIRPRQVQDYWWLCSMGGKRVIMTLLWMNLACNAYVNESEPRDSRCWGACAVSARPMFNKSFCLMKRPMLKHEVAQDLSLQYAFTGELECDSFQESQYFPQVYSGLVYFVARQHDEHVTFFFRGTRKLIACCINLQGRSAVVSHCNCSKPQTTGDSDKQIALFKTR